MGDRRKCQTYTASPAEPGGLPVMLGRFGKKLGIGTSVVQRVFKEVPWS